MKEPFMQQRSLIDQLCEYDTALLANTIGYLDPTPPEQYYMGGSIRSLTPTVAPTAGIAVTTVWDGCSPGKEDDADAFWTLMDQMRAMDAPSIWVVQAVGPRPDHNCIMGDGMAKMMHSCGAVGVVTNGGVRDIPGMMATPFSVHARGTVIHHTGCRCISINQPVEVGGITVNPSDMLHTNAEGVIKIPPGCAEQLPEAAARMRAFEHEVHRISRQKNVSATEVQAATQQALEKYGFAESSATGSGEVWSTQPKK